MSSNQTLITSIWAGGLFSFLLAATFLLFLGVDAPQSAVGAVFRMAVVYALAISPLVIFAMTKQSATFRWTVGLTAPTLLILAYLINSFGNQLSTGVARLFLALLIVFICCVCLQAVETMRLKSADGTNR